MLEATGARRVGFRYGFSDKRAVSVLSALKLLQFLPVLMVKLSLKAAENTE